MDNLVQQITYDIHIYKEFFSTAYPYVSDY